MCWQRFIALGRALRLWGRATVCGLRGAGQGRVVTWAGEQEEGAVPGDTQQETEDRS